MTEDVGEWVNVFEASRRTRDSVQFVKLLCKAGELRARVTDDKVLLVSVQSIEEYLERRAKRLKPGDRPVRLRLWP